MTDNLTTNSTNHLTNDLSNNLTNNNNDLDNDLTDKSIDNLNDKFNNNDVGIINKLDFTKLEKNEKRIYYQKLRLFDWPPVNMIDKSFECIFCIRLYSPRSIIPITKKVPRADIENSALLISPRLDSPHKPDPMASPRKNDILLNKDSPRTSMKKNNVEYCCINCANSIRSTTSSPRNTLEFSKSSPSITPRDKPQTPSVIERRLSNSGTLPINGSPQRERSSPIKILRRVSQSHTRSISPLVSPIASPMPSPLLATKKQHKKKLSRSKTVDSAAMNQHLTDCTLLHVNSMLEYFDATD